MLSNTHEIVMCISFYKNKKKKMCMRLYIVFKCWWLLNHLRGFGKTSTFMQCKLK
jgi:hypothetical protein